MVRLKHSLQSGLIATVTAVFMLGLLPDSASSSSVQPLALADLTDLADTIVHARCTGTTTEWRNEKIFTQASFEVIEAVKGQASELTVTLLGGTATHPVLRAPVTMQVAGGATFSQGEEVVLFLASNSRSERQVIGLSMGKYRVRTDPNSGTKTVSSSNKKLVAETRAAAGGDRKVLSVEDLALTEFLQRIRKTMNTARPASGAAPGER